MTATGTVDPLSVGGDQKVEMLRLARCALERFVQRGDTSIETTEVPALLLPRAVFVTLRAGDGGLRGCIGTVAAADSLAEGVQRCAMSAAADPRFDPVTPQDIGRIRIEISVLGPMSRVTGPHEIEAGRHGILISKSWKRGLLLPQVAREQGWGAERFVEEGCMKAGLSRDAWRQGAVMDIFTAEIFSEGESLGAGALLGGPGAPT